MVRIVELFPISQFNNIENLITHFLLHTSYSLYFEILFLKYNFSAHVAIYVNEYVIRNVQVSLFLIKSN